MDSRMRPRPSQQTARTGHPDLAQLFGPTTVKQSAVLVVRLPEVPVMATLALPTFAVASAVKVSKLLEVAGFGLNEAVTPAGRLEAASVTTPEKPSTG